MASVRSQPLRSIQRLIRPSLPCAVGHREYARKILLNLRSPRIGNLPLQGRSLLREKVGDADDAQQKHQACNDLWRIHVGHSVC
jgi:hypothetical protein